MFFFLFFLDVSYCLTTFDKSIKYEIIVIFAVISDFKWGFPLAFYNKNRFNHILHIYEPTCFESSLF